MPTRTNELLERAHRALAIFTGEMFRFGVVGVISFVIDLGGYNLLVFGPQLMNLLGEGQTAGVLHAKPLTARIISASLGTFAAWLGNRLWTFRHRRQRAAAHEISLFVLVNLAAMAIAVACLSIPRYLLGVNSPLADNAANLIGIGLGAMFRFWAYRKYVFAGKPTAIAETTRLRERPLKTRR